MITMKNIPLINDNEPDVDRITRTDGVPYVNTREEALELIEDLKSKNVVFKIRNHPDWRQSPTYTDLLAYDAMRRRAVEEQDDGMALWFILVDFASKVATQNKSSTVFQHTLNRPWNNINTGEIVYSMGQYSVDDVDTIRKITVDELADVIMGKLEITTKGGYGDECTHCGEVLRLSVCGNELKRYAQTTGESCKDYTETVCEVEFPTGNMIITDMMTGDDFEEIAKHYGIEGEIYNQRSVRSRHDCAALLSRLGGYCGYVGGDYPDIYESSCRSQLFIGEEGYVEHPDDYDRVVTDVFGGTRLTEYFNIEWWLTMFDKQCFEKIYHEVFGAEAQDKLNEIYTHFSYHEFKIQPGKWRVVNTREKYPYPYGKTNIEQLFFFVQKRPFFTFTKL